MKVGICTGGGDCPGLNAVIRAAVKHGIQNYGFEMIGIEDCFNGLLKKPLGVMKLEIDTVTDILSKGGTILGTTNSGNPFSLKNPQNPGTTSDHSKEVYEAYKSLGLDCLVVIGGDGTQGIAYELSKLGINIIGVPKTIDNDLAATDQTVGFDTAFEIVSSATERLQSTAESHDRIMVVEVMGRHAGHLALHSGIAAGAHVVLLPEIPFDLEKVANKILSRNKMGRHYSVVVVAEGAYPKGDEAVFTKTSSGTLNLGGIGAQVADKLYQKTKMETRVTVLGHTQRGGTPSSFDRVLGTLYGYMAIEMVNEKRFGKLAAYIGGKIQYIDYKTVAGRFRPVDIENDQYVKAAEAIGICLGR